MSCDGEDRWKRSRVHVMRLVWDILHLKSDGNVQERVSGGQLFLLV